MTARTVVKPDRAGSRVPGRRRCWQAAAPDRRVVVRVGNNLNQAVTALCTTAHAPTALDQAADQCRQVIDQVEIIITEVDRGLR